MSRSALSVIIMALLPPNSRRALPRRAPTTAPTDFPIRVEPVAETSAILGSFAIISPVSRPPARSPDTPSGTLFSLKTAAAIFWQATAVSGVFSEGFHIQTSPHTQAIIAFHDQTATGKLKRSEEHTSELQSLMRISYAVFCLKKI